MTICARRLCRPRISACAIGSSASTRAAIGCMPEPRRGQPSRRPRPEAWKTVRHDQEADPAQRLQHELRGPHQPWAVDASARYLHRLQDAGLLDPPCPAAGARPVRWPVPGRHRRRVRRVPGLGRPDPARIHPAAGQRPAADRAGHGGGYAPPGLRRHRQPDLRDALSAGAPLLHAGPPDPGPRGLEHRHRLPGERGARHGAVRADRARRALRPRRRIPGRGLSAVGRQLGRGRGQGRQARAGLCRSRRRAPGGP